jgi:hypothetical protein
VLRSIGRGPALPRFRLFLDDLSRVGADLPVYAEAARFAARLCAVGRP